jgi:hypothetical protein
MKVVELKERCKELGLKTTGTKKQLQERYDRAMQCKVSFPRHQLLVHPLQENWLVDPNTSYVWEKDCIIGTWHPKRGLLDLTKADFVFLNSNILFQNFRKKIPLILKGETLSTKRKKQDNGDESEEEVDE